MGGRELDSSASGQGKLMALENQAIIRLIPQNMGNFLTSGRTVTRTLLMKLIRRRSSYRVYSIQYTVGWLVDWLFVWLFG
jgi:hypothetical protein